MNEMKERLLKRQKGTSFIMYFDVICTTTQTHTQMCLFGELLVIVFVCVCVCFCEGQGGKRQRERFLTCDMYFVWHHFCVLRARDTHTHTHRHTHTHIHTHNLVLFVKFFCLFFLLPPPPPPCMWVVFLLFFSLFSFLFFSSGMWEWKRVVWLQVTKRPWTNLSHVVLYCHCF